MQASTPRRIHCASVCEKPCRVTLPKQAELPEVVSLRPYKACGMLCLAEELSAALGGETTTCLMPPMLSWVE